MSTRTNNKEKEREARRQEWKNSPHNANNKPKQMGKFGMQDLKQIGNRVNAAVQNVRQNIKNKISPSTPTPTPPPTPTPTPPTAPINSPPQQQSKRSILKEKKRLQDEATRKFEENARKRDEESNEIPGHASSDRSHARLTETQLARDKKTINRELERQREREAKREAWRSSEENANNKGSLKDKIKRKVKEFTGDVAEGVADTVEDMGNDFDGKPKEKPVFTMVPGSKQYSVDQNNILHILVDGKWVSKGHEPKYNNVKGVKTLDTSDDVKDIPDVLGVTKSHARDTTRKHRVPRGGGEEESPLDEPEAAISAPKGIISSGVLSSSRYGDGYDEEAEKERLAKFDQSGSSLKVGSGYISAGSYKGSGYDQKKETERLESFNRAGSPLSAGLGYVSSGSYKSTNPQAAAGAHLGELSGADVFSSGAFRVSYGNKPKTEPEVDVGKQIDLEMARVANLQTRQAQLTQLAELQRMQQKLQPVGSIRMQPHTDPQQQIVIPTTQTVQPPEDALEFLFGLKNRVGVSTPQKQRGGSVTAQLFGSQKSGYPQKPSPKSNLSATAQLFGAGIMKQQPASPKSKGGSATADFFNLKMVTETPIIPTNTKAKLVGKYGAKQVHKTKQIVDVKPYIPKNYVPNSKGGILGIYEKNAKLKPSAKPKRMQPTAAEFLFSGRK